MNVAGPISRREKKFEIFLLYFLRTCVNGNRKQTEVKSDILTSTFISIRTVLHGMAARIVGSEEDADDAIHDAFCRLWSVHPEISDRTEAVKLSYTAVRNSAIDTLRRSRRGRLISIDEIPSTAVQPDDTSSRDMQATYQAVVSLAQRVLSERQFRVFRLHDIEGVKYADVADDMGLTVENVRMILSRARKTIREIYRQQNQEI